MTYATYTPEQVEAIFASIPQEVAKAMKKPYFKQMGRGEIGARAIMEMTFEEWAAIWWDSGKWEVRGRTKDKPYQMCRKNDEGSYSMGNVRIDTYKSNQADCYEKLAAIVSKSSKARFSKPVIGINKITGEQRQWASITEAAKELQCPQPNISMVLTGKIKSAKGFYWKYLNKE